MQDTTISVVVDFDWGVDAAGTGEIDGLAGGGVDDNMLVIHLRFSATALRNRLCRIRAEIAAQLHLLRHPELDVPRAVVGGGGGHLFFRGGEFGEFDALHRFFVFFDGGGSAEDGGEDDDGGGG